jgi:hypothetical protein
MDRFIDKVPAALRRLRQDAEEWCRGRHWALRIPVWLLLAFLGVLQAVRPESWTPFSGINLPLHEGGHLLFRWFGEGFLHAFGGTLLQLFAPLAAAVAFLKQRDYFAIAFCLGWWSTNLVGTGVYMADARALQLPLVTAEGGGGDITHDWEYLFSRVGLLGHCEAIGWLTRQAGNLAMLAALAFGGWLIVQMFRTREEGEAE